MNLTLNKIIENLKFDANHFLIQSFKKNIRQYTMVIALLVIWVTFTFLTGSLFLSPRNLSNLFLQSATIGVLAIGMTMVLVAGSSRFICRICCWIYRSCCGYFTSKL
ncbi:MAG: hypothetical protein K2X69_17520 [Silvanigrellaceae bacterium]|nr:hypothetical protein [Silvanigrellaceae bacterium]